MKKEFEQQVLDHGAYDALEQDTPFFILYYAVQAIGSQYDGYGAFEPGTGESWQLFQAALGRLEELMVSKPGIVGIQVHKFYSLCVSD